MAKKRSAHRPIEYILYVVLVVLVITAFFIIWQTDKITDKTDATAVSESEISIEDIGQILEREINQEDSLIKENDTEYEARITEVGNVMTEYGALYDETSY